MSVNIKRIKKISTIIRNIPMKSLIIKNVKDIFSRYRSICRLQRANTATKIIIITKNIIEKFKDNINYSFKYGI